MEVKVGIRREVVKRKENVELFISYAKQHKDIH